jgi:starvation-inducible DNA-binding protein
MMDLLAERIVQLGGTAECTIQVAAKRTELKEYPPHISGEMDHIDALSSALAASQECALRHRSDRRTRRKDTADIVTEISRGVDKYLWFVEAHIG